MPAQPSMSLPVVKGFAACSFSPLVLRFLPPRLGCNTSVSLKLGSCTWAITSPHHLLSARPGPSRSPFALGARVNRWEEHAPSTESVVLNNLAGLRAYPLQHRCVDGLLRLLLSSLDRHPCRLEPRAFRHDALRQVPPQRNGQSPGHRDDHDPLAARATALRSPGKPPRNRAVGLITQP